MLRFCDKNNVDVTNKLQYCNNPSCLGEPWCSAWGICKDLALQPVMTAKEESYPVVQEAASYSDNDEMEQQFDIVLLEMSQYLNNEEQYSTVQLADIAS